MDGTKFCKHCGEKIAIDAIICPKCGRQVEELKTSKAESVIINNNNAVSASASSASYGAVCGRCCNKWVALFLCLFLGFIGAHKFYEGKFGTGIFYIITFGVFGIGWIIDFFNILGKPVRYYVN